LLLGALELSHPARTDAATVGDWWIPLHMLLIAGYAGLVWSLWGRSTATRVTLIAFLIPNTAFLAVDGIAVGLLASADPDSATAVWQSPVVAALADLTGATWAAALLVQAAMRLPSGGRPRATQVGLVLTWLTHVLGRFLPLAGALSRVAALAVGASLVYSAGIQGIAPALLTFAAVIPQHAGAEAALGMLCLAVAAALRERSAPVAGSPP
jgi:hypothetical protein